MPKYTKLHSSAGLLRRSKAAITSAIFLIKSSFKFVDSQIIKGKQEILRVLIMDNRNERRTEQRLCYLSPVWFGEHPQDALAQGQMVDISSRGAAFITYTHDGCPRLGEHITARFKVPHYRPDNFFDMVNFTRSARVCRVDKVYSYWRRVAVQFAEPLPFKPGENC